ncbi:hypothetical protein SK854_39745 [Lentzea sp. BCCO 10_0061]|uniref:Sec translocon accessory complex subunit YajC n=1 Tax=Lentzea sokolovensis TaxID=3095429 RepID=A0ABU4V925_9PSEU|nr:hypothetical protein [Lentzea sp. BCCO 10_0061]MDX8148303.1 hypothetical protein [Lentzea sp. BCCO 10_0061]
MLSPDFSLGSTVALVAVQPSNTNDGNDKGGQGEDFGKSSPVGLVLLIVFFIAIFFLVKSMNKHIKGLPASFDEPAEGAAPAAEPSESADESSASSASSKAAKASKKKD